MKGMIIIMLKDLAKKYYSELDMNCAEAILLAGNDYYNLDLKDRDFTLISGFGGGMGCGSTCGALAGAIAVIGKMKVEKNAHSTESFGKTCGNFVGEFRDALGHTDCTPLALKFKKPEQGCLATVELAAEVLEKYLCQK